MSLISNEQNQPNMDCISNNIPSRAYRYATESKNVLNEAGAMYVGTGIKRKTTMFLDDGETVAVSYDSYITAVLYPPALYTPISVDDLKLCLQPVTLGYAQSGSCSYNQTTNSYVPTSNTLAYVADGYIASSDTEGASTQTKLMPCWITSRGVVVSIPVLLG